MTEHEKLTWKDQEQLAWDLAAVGDYLDIAAIRARCEATPHGPWNWRGGYPQQITNPGAVLIAECFENSDFPSAIAEFISDARQDVPALCAEVDRLRADLADARRERDVARWMLVAERQAIRATVEIHRGHRGTGAVCAEQILTDIDSRILSAGGTGPAKGGGDE